MATTREFLNAIITGTFSVKVSSEETSSAPAFITNEDGTISASGDMIAFAKAEIDKLDKKNANRKNKPSKTQEGNAKIKEDIVKALTEFGDTMLCADIAKLLDVSTQKVSALMRQLSDDGLVTISDVKIKGKGKVKGYSLTAESSGDDMVNEEEGE